MFEYIARESTAYSGRLFHGRGGQQAGGDHDGSAHQVGKGGAEAQHEGADDGPDDAGQRAARLRDAEHAALMPRPRPRARSATTATAC